jgi:hypothetical protein
LIALTGGAGLADLIFSRIELFRRWDRACWCETGVSALAEARCRSLFKVSTCLLK